MNEYNPKGKRHVVIKNNIKIPPNASNVIVLMSPCRSGSTAFLNIFGQGMNLLSIYQPIKSVLRFKIFNMKKEFILPSSNTEKHIFIKETFGPYTSIESTYNPIRELNNAGLLNNKINVILLIRDPKATYQSWLKNWSMLVSRDQLTKNFIKSYKNTLKIYKYCTKNKIPNTIFVYEWLSNPKIINEKLMKMLFSSNLDFSPNILKGWNNDSKRIIFSQEPDIYNRIEVSKLHSTFRTTKRLKYQKPRTGVRLLASELIKINKCYEIYNLLRKIN